jgi:hypothetical protein
MNAKNDAMLKTRALDEDFLKSLLSGELKDMVDKIKGDNTLCLCFRRQYVNVYYKGDSLLKIRRFAQSYNLIFNFNHARYTKEHQQRLRVLEGLGFKYPKGGRDRTNRQLTCKYPQDNKANTLFWQESIRVLKSLVDDFLDTQKKYDWFKLHRKEKKNSWHLEKQRQQEIMMTNNTLSGEYFIYDMEYDQPRNSSKEKKSGRFDMLALRRMGNGCFNLVFIELKSTRNSCDGKSGIEKHCDDLNRYIENETLMETRKNEAYEICCQYERLGFVEQENIKVEEKEVLFVFTDEAVNYAQKISDPFKKCILSSENLRLKFNKGIL